MAAEPRLQPTPTSLESGLQRGGAGLAIRRFVRRQPLGTAAAIVILLFIVAAAFAPQLSPRRYDKQDVVARLEGPSRQALFGTDDLGRDMFSRIIYGARISLVVSLGAVALGLCLGGFWGIISAYHGGTVDLVVQRFMDSMLSVPLLLMALVIVTILGASLVNVILAMGVILTPTVNRIVRSQVLAVRGLPYIEAAHAAGAGSVRIILRHIVPNVLPVLIIISTINLGAAIITEASLSFLGLGVPPPYPTWGGLLSGTGRTFMRDAPWLAIFPGVVISLTVLAFNVLGDALRDVLDPRLRT